MKMPPFIKLLFILAVLTMARMTWGYGQREPGINIQRESGFEFINSLAEKFRTNRDEAVLHQIISLMDDRKHGAIAANSLKYLKPHLSKKQIEAIVVPALTKGFSISNKFARRESAITLLEYSEFAAPAIPTLRESLPKEDEVATFAVRTLGGIGSAASAAIPDLAALLKEPEPDIEMQGGFEHASMRVYVAEAIGKIGVASNEARSALEGALEDPNHHVTVKSVIALLSNKIISPPVLPAITRLISSPNKWARWDMVDAIDQMGEAHPQVVEALKAATLDADSDVRTTATRIVNRAQAKD